MNEEDIPDLNIFMMCEKLNSNSVPKIPDGYHIRKEEFDIWCRFPLDNDADKKQYKGFMKEYYNDVYRLRLNELHNKCLFLCDERDKPISTCFVWKAYNKINTIHWFKTLKEYEGKGLGRAILSYAMNKLKEKDYPVFLHAQSSSFRAIELYSDFGFKIVTNDIIGYRKNNYKESLPILK